ncbi:MAG: OmpA family protein, partial [Gammaproteobacteria bacterium]
VVAPPPPPPPPPADSDGDGVLDGADACPGTPAGARVNARGCEEQLVLQGVTFENNSAKLTPNSTLTLDSVAEIIKQRPTFKIEVRGHTDSSGPDEYNLNLSQQRADAVMEYLVSRGVSADKLSATGFGESEPVAPNDTAEGRAQNRRVALEFTESN